MSSSAATTTVALGFAILGADETVVLCMDAAKLGPSTAPGRVEVAAVASEPLWRAARAPGRHRQRAPSGVLPVQGARRLEPRAAAQVTASAAARAWAEVWDLETYACLVTHRGDAPYAAVAATTTVIVAGR
jgi:hypothetical protein